MIYGFKARYSVIFSNIHSASNELWNFIFFLRSTVSYRTCYIFYISFFGSEYKLGRAEYPKKMFNLLCHRHFLLVLCKQSFIFKFEESGMSKSAYTAFVKKYKSEIFGNISYTISYKLNCRIECFRLRLVKIGGEFQISKA